MAPHFSYRSLATLLTCCFAIALQAGCDDDDTSADPGVTDAAIAADDGVQPDGATEADAELDTGVVDAEVDAAPDAAPEPDAAVIDPPPADDDFYVVIAAGDYTIGTEGDEVGREDENEQRRAVTFSEHVRIARHEVTQAKFSEIMGYNPSDNAGCATCPVEQVTWHDAAAYTLVISEAAGLEHCYDCSGLGEALRCTTIRSPHECAGFRLPTEAEWEVAARAGTHAAYPNGGNLRPEDEYNFNVDLTLDNGELISTFAWYQPNSAGVSHPVGTLAPNARGLYDVTGNAQEWCHDWFEETPAAVDPHGPANGDFRVIRGGSFNTPAAYLRLGYRNWSEPHEVMFVTGFRLARTVFE